MWCLISMAACAAICGLAALVIRPSQVRLPRPRPTRLLRGCIATTFLLVALALGGAAVLLATR